jgi:hypothetical protein
LGSVYVAWDLLHNQFPVRHECAISCAGGFLGEIVVATEGGEILRNSRVSTSNNSITNALELAESPSGALLLTSANNDDHVRVLDIERPHPLHEIELPWAANAATLDPANRCVWYNLFPLR